MQFCSVFSQEQGQDPVGTARYADLFLIMEMEPPWPAEVFTAAQVPAGLVPLFKRVRATGVNLKTNAIAPDPRYSRRGHTRIFLFRQPRPPFTAYEKLEYVVPVEKTVPLVGALLAHAAGEKEGDTPQPLAAFAPYRQDTAATRELFVCIHKEKDACCGRFGPDVYDTLRHEVVPQLAEPTRVWQISHIGGHRLAPTLIDLPGGRYWGHLTPAIAAHIARRDVPPAQLARNYRGWALLNSPFLQTAERELFGEVGWAWSAQAVQARLEEPAGDGPATATFMWERAGEGGGSRQIQVEPAPPVPTITCSEPPQHGTMPQFRVVAAR